jgi:hypothetical protein
MATLSPLLERARTLWVLCLVSGRMLFHDDLLGPPLHWQIKISKPISESLISWASTTGVTAGPRCTSMPSFPYVPTTNSTSQAGPRLLLLTSTTHEPTALLTQSHPTSRFCPGAPHPHAAPLEARARRRLDLGLDRSCLQVAF